MSFILDALKKSENERQKQSGPALYEVKVAAPPRRFPVWAIVVGVLLGVNLIVLIAVLLRRDKQDPAVQATQAQIAANAQNAAGAATGAGALPSPSAAGAAPNGAYGANAGPAPGQGLPSTTPANGAAIGPDGLPVATGSFQATPGNPASAGATAPPTRFNPPLVEEDPAAYDETSSAPAPRGAPVNPADYMPANAGPAPTSPGAAPMPQPAGYPMNAGTGPAAPPGRAGPSTVRTASAVPSRDDLMASGMGDIPPANLSLHVYDRNPSARFVFVNGARAKEGDTLPNGLRVDEITPEGAVLSFRGSRFLVPIQ